MGILDSVRRNKVEKEEKDAPLVTGPTLDEVMQDPEQFHLFGEMLKASGNESLGERMVAKNLDPDDFAILERQRKIFNKKMESAEKAEKWLTKENIMDLARNHPRFKDFIGVLGPDRAIEAIQSQLKSMSITDEGRFRKLFSSIERSESYKNSGYKKIDEDVEKFLKDKNITPQEYLDVLAIKDPTEKGKAIVKLAEKSQGFFKETKKVINWLSRGKWAKNTTFPDLIKNLDLTEISIAQLDKYQKDIGAALFAISNGNDDMRKAMSHALVGEEVKEKSPKGFQELKREAFDEKEYDKEWEKEKKDKKFSSKSSQEQEVIKDAFTQKAKDYYKDKNDDGSFWAYVFAAFFDKKIEDKKAKLK